MGEDYKAGVYAEELIPTIWNFFTGQATKSYRLELSGIISINGVVLKEKDLDTDHIFAFKFDEDELISEMSVT